MLNTQNKFGFNRYLKWLLIIPCWLMVIEKSFAQGIEFDQPNNPNNNDITLKFEQ